MATYESRAKALAKLTYAICTNCKKCLNSLAHRRPSFIIKKLLCTLTRSVRLPRCICWYTPNEKVSSGFSKKCITIEAVFCWRDPQQIQSYFGQPPHQWVYVPKIPVKDCQHRFSSISSHQLGILERKRFQVSLNNHYILSQTSNSAIGKAPNCKPYDDWWMRDLSIHRDIQHFWDWYRDNLQFRIVRSSHVGAKFYRWALFIGAIFPQEV